MNPTTDKLWSSPLHNSVTNIPTPRPDPIPEQTETIQRNLDDLHKALNLLTDKLGSVISSAEEPKEVGLTGDSYGSSSLAVCLHSLGCSVNAATMRVHALMRRIEL